MTKHCFTSGNFLKVKEYILFRLSVSGMGKFYIEYPAPPNKESDQKPGNKKLPAVLENVFDISAHTSENIIVFKNESHVFYFDSDKGLIEEIPNNEEIKLANEIFCYLLSLASNR